VPGPHHRAPGLARGLGATSSGGFVPGS